MKIMKKEIYEILKKIIAGEYPDFSDTDFNIDYPDAKFGDYSTNLALILSKRVGKSPKEIAENIVKKLSESDNNIFEKVEIAGPGFINFKIAVPYLNQKTLVIINSGEGYGKTNEGASKKVDIDFISANPTGPLTVGNSRGGVIGDVIGKVLEKVGYVVTREYYFNDAGGQIDVLGHSVLKDTEAQYKGQYIDELNQKYTTGDYKEVGKKAAGELVQEIKKTAEKMGIKFDVWFAEGKDLRDKGKVNEIVAWLKENKLAYESEGAVWFKSTQFGDDKDRVLIRSNGEPTYFCVDCAYHKNKLEERKFDLAIDVWGADHHGDMARIKGFVKALGYEKNLEIVIHQFVRIMKDGKEVRMSKRTGNYITVEELLAEVGKDAYRFFMMQYALNTHMDFDLELAKDKTQKNPVYYVQYAYARIASILAKGNPPAGGDITNVKVDIVKDMLKAPEERALILQLIKFPELVTEISKDYQIQKLPQYSKELAESFHHFYEKCPVINSGSDELTQARLQLLNATQIVLKNTLDLMGISAPKKM